jgi:hypothetical protein
LWATLRQSPFGLFADNLSPGRLCRIRTQQPL